MAVSQKARTATSLKGVLPRPGQPFLGLSAVARRALPPWLNEDFAALRRSAAPLPSPDDCRHVPQHWGVGGGPRGVRVRVSDARTRGSSSAPASPTLAADFSRTRAERASVPSWDAQNVLEATNGRVISLVGVARARRAGYAKRARRENASFARFVMLRAERRDNSGSLPCRACHMVCALCCGGWICQCL